MPSIIGLEKPLRELLGVMSEVHEARPLLTNIADVLGKLEAITPSDLEQRLREALGSGNDDLLLEAADTHGAQERALFIAAERVKFDTARIAELEKKCVAAAQAVVASDCARGELLGRVKEAEAQVASGIEYSRKLREEGHEGLAHELMDALAPPSHPRGAPSV
jgi:hypothetical protein